MSEPEQECSPPDGFYTTAYKEAIMSDQSIPAHVTYKDIPNFPGYRVGDDGSVWSCWNRGKRAFTDTWRQLKARIGSHGYYYVNLSRGRIYKSFCVHTLVLITFVGPRPQDFEGCHGIGGPLDNSIKNLRWGTRRENASDKIPHGTLCCGTLHPASKLSLQEIDDIRNRYAKGGIYQYELGEEYGVHQSVISEIVNYKAWKIRK